MQYEIMRKIMKRTASKYNISEKFFDEILLEYKRTELIDRISLSLHRYDENGIEGLADGAMALNTLYESVDNMSVITRNYFKTYYETWICLVLETEQGEIYSYTKKDIVMVLRGLNVHGTVKGTNKRRKYLIKFLDKVNSPSVLFIDGGRNIGCLPEHKRKEYLEKDYPFILTTKYNLDMKEIVMLNILGEFFTYHVKKDLYNDHPSLMMETAYLMQKAPDIANKVLEQINIIRQKNPRQHAKA